MPQKKRYRTPFEHERIEYSVIVTRFSDTQFEPLIPGQNREKDLTDYREPFILQTRTQDDGTCRQDWHCNSLLNRLRLKRDQKRIPGLAVRFGPRVPKDYYGNYDYDPLGGYGPDVAFYGD